MKELHKFADIGGSPVLDVEQGYLWRRVETDSDKHYKRGRAKHAV
ncbi:MAG: hypothetical protein Q7R79_03855 [bacterium]|nr:hypothetical protein [bacterium]